MEGQFNDTGEKNERRKPLSAEEKAKKKQEAKESPPPAALFSALGPFLLYRRKVLIKKVDRAKAVISKQRNLDRGLVFSTTPTALVFLPNLGLSSGITEEQVRKLLEQVHNKANFNRPPLHLHKHTNIAAIATGT